MQQQAALVAATTGQAAGATYLSPITGLPTAQIAPAAALNGLANAVCTPTSGILNNLIKYKVPTEYHNVNSQS